MTELDQHLIAVILSICISVLYISGWRKEAWIILSMVFMMTMVIVEFRMAHIQWIDFARMAETERRVQAHIAKNDWIELVRLVLDAAHDQTVMNERINDLEKTWFQPRYAVCL